MAEETKPTEVTTQADPTPAEKTYTQAELDEVVAKQTKGIPSKDELNAFKEWQKSQKSEAEKMAEREAEYTRTNQELTMLRAEKKVTSMNAKPEFSEFIASKVIAMGEDFDTNVVKFKKDNPQYFGDTVVKRVSTAPSLSGGNVGSTTTNQIMNDVIRNR